MKKLFIVCTIIATGLLISCGQTVQQDNATHNADTMVIKENKTDSATNTISKDTTKR